MKTLLYLVTATAFVSQFRDLISLLGPAGRIVKLLPDFASGLLFVAILLSFGSSKRLIISPKYVIVGAILLLHMIFGAIANSMSPGAFVEGLRNYFAFVPLFLLPAVHDFSEEDLKKFFKFLLILSLLQVPVSLYQRIFLFPVTPTGDVVRGMFASGAIMSTFLICVIVVLLAMFLRGRLSKAGAFCLTVTLTIPMWINETKGTVILFPIAMFAVAMFASDPARRFRVFLLSLSVSVVFVAAFTIAYDYFFPKEGSRYALVEFFTEDAIDTVYKDPDAAYVGRVDSIVYAYQALSEDPTNLLMGLGIGNVSNPETFDVIVGDYGDYYEEYGATTTSYTSLLWELGVIGILMTWLVLWMILGDARRLAEGTSWENAFGLGCAGVVVMLPVALLYKDFVSQNVFIVVAMFVAGVVASKSAATVTHIRSFDTNRNSLLDSYKGA